MLPFPQNTQGGSPPTQPAASTCSTAFQRHRATQVPQVTKNQSLRLALAERMCDIEVQAAMPFRAPTRGWQPAYAPQGGVITPAAARSFPRWGTMGYGDNLLMIKAFAKACISASAATALPFNHTSRGWKANRLGKSFLEVVPLIEAWACVPRVDMSLDPQLELAVEVFEQIGLLEGTAMGPVGQVERWFAQGCAAASVAVLVNAFVAELGKRGRQVGIGRRMQRHEHMHTARRREVRSYVAGVLKRHPGCEVMRFELCMSRNSKLNKQEEYGFMLAASARYLRELKEVFGEAIVGCIRKVDRGATSPYLVHILLVVDGPSVHELDSIRQGVSDQWTAQTQGVGYLIDSNAVDVFRYRGTGSQSRHYDSTASQLDKAVTFLADTDRMIQVGHDGARDGLVWKSAWISGCQYSAISRRS